MQYPIAKDTNSCWIYSNIHVLSVLFDRLNGIRIGVSTPHSIISQLISFYVRYISPINTIHSIPQNPYINSIYNTSHIHNVLKPIPPPPRRGPFQRSPKPKPTPNTSNKRLQTKPPSHPNPRPIPLTAFLHQPPRHARNLHHERRAFYDLLSRTSAGRCKDRRRHYCLGEDYE